MADGITLLDAAGMVDVLMNVSCNGKGACGKSKRVQASENAGSTFTPLLIKAAESIGVYGAF